jgi:molybdopterin-guanine dinucleotide biosynthesis protein A
LPALRKEQITGLVLAGGRGSRMGGLDKGLQLFQGKPLVRHVLQRLVPQVGTLMVNANRNLHEYAALGVQVWPDELADYPGPLAGLAAGMAHCPTPYLASVPCDTPHFPIDLVARLAQALTQQQAEIAIAATVERGEVRLQPVFCLLPASLLPGLLRFVRGGQRKVEHWTAMHRCANVTFDDAAAFFNANTLADLQPPRP